MNSTSYILWDRIKKQRKEEGCEIRTLSLDGTKSGVTAAYQLKEAGMITILHINKYSLTYKLV